jgi:hypothetical protein
MSKKYHILNGDCLNDQLKNTPIDGNMIIFRECLIDGPVNGETLNEFWQNRASFISKEYKVLQTEYYNKTVVEFKKIIQIPNGADLCLWFEHDLFCQVNMWFLISVLSNRTGLNVFRISPICHHEKEFWRGFGASTPEMLSQAYQEKILLKDQDFKLGCDLWEAYRKHDLLAMKKLSNQTSGCFYMLEEVCQAHIDRFGLNQNDGKPEKLVREILQEGHKPFDDVMQEFSEVGGIYGIGDLQLKKIYEREIKLM